MARNCNWVQRTETSKECLTCGDWSIDIPEDDEWLNDDDGWYTEDTFTNLPVQGLYRDFGELYEVINNAYQAQINSFNVPVDIMVVIGVGMMYGYIDYTEDGELLVTSTSNTQ